MTASKQVSGAGPQQQSGSNREEAPSDHARGAWDSKMQFLMSCISLSVGLGNVWRFPYLVQKYGGGAFLVPYIVMMVVEGAPLFLLELGIGQRLRLGSLGVWNKVHPWSAGIGITSTIVSFLVGLYYNVVVCWCFYYLFNSFSNPLPFGQISPELNETSTELFWYRHAQKASGSILELGEVNWQMALCLLLSWLIVFFCIMRGLQSSGKVMYFTATFPYLILLAFLCKAVTLEGAFDGIKVLLTPDLSQLKNFEVWMAAATQVFYSLGLGFGSLIAFASYNPAHNNCRNDAVFMSVITVFTALFASVDIFAVLGHKAVMKEAECQRSVICDTNGYFCASSAAEFRSSFNSTNLNLSTTQRGEFGKCQEIFQAFVNGSSTEGPGLAFIAFTEAILMLPFPQLWSVAFFMMLLALGLGSQFGTMEGVITNLFDMNIKVRKEVLTGTVCLVSFLIGMIFVTSAGTYWVNLFDNFAGTFGLVIVGLFELIVVCYVYGHKRFTDELEEMFGVRPGIYWQVMWRLFAPILILVIIVGSLVKMIGDKMTYSVWIDSEVKTASVPYPDSILVVATLLVLLTITPLPIIYLTRRFQWRRADYDPQQAVMRRVDTTLSTTEIIQREEDDSYMESPMGVEHCLAPVWQSNIPEKAEQKK